MSKRTGLPFAIPPVAILSKTTEGASVEFLMDGEKFFWEGKLKKSTPESVRQGLLDWICIQRERKRLGLPYLTAEELTDPIR